MAQGYPIWSGAFWNLNERERREKKIEDEALMRELAKLAAQAGYEKEIAEMRERGATDRTRMGEEGAEKRSKRSEDEAMARARFGAGAQMENTQIAQEGSMARQAAELALREKLAQDARQAEIDSQGRDFLTRLGAIKTEYNAKGELNEADWKREEANRRKAQEIAERNSYAQYLQSLALYGRDNDIVPELLTLGNIPAGKTNVPAGTTLKPDGSAKKSGRILLPSSKSTPPKPGETPRSPDNAAPEVPVKVGPKPPTAETKFDSIGNLGQGLLDSIHNNTWGVGPDSKNMQTGQPAEQSSILDALGKELGYNQRRPAIKK